MMNAIIYVYYRIKKINPNYEIIVISVQFLFIAVIHLILLIWILDEIFQSSLFRNFWGVVENDDVVTRRMIMLPILILPLWIPIYLFLRKNNERILEGCKKLESMSKEEKRKKNLFLWLYIIGSFAFLILGMTSSGWIPKSQ